MANLHTVFHRVLLPLHPSAHTLPVDGPRIPSPFYRVHLVSKQKKHRCNGVAQAAGAPPSLISSQISTMAPSRNSRPYQGPTYFAPSVDGTYSAFSMAMNGIKGNTGLSASAGDDMMTAYTPDDKRIADVRSLSFFLSSRTWTNSWVQGVQACRLPSPTEQVLGPVSPPTETRCVVTAHRATKRHFSEGRLFS
jgi:hypothetical protein